MQGFHVFETAIGPCGIAWGPRGVTGIQLPEASAAATRARLAERFPGACELDPPHHVKATTASICALLRGESHDFSDVELDLAQVSPFYRRVYEVARTIPAGSTLSYGEVAARLGAPGSARAVGQALGKNPFAIVVPCHRVLASGGKLGGFTARGGTDTKVRLLDIERAQTSRRPGSLNRFDFDTELAVREICEADPKLARWIERLGPFQMRIEETSSLFMALARSIVYQQLSGKAAATIFGRVCALFPDQPTGFEPMHLASKADEVLRAAGLSRNKLLAVRDLSEKAQQGILPSLDQARELPEAELIERLTQIRGIGRWTVEMILMFRLGRSDILPLDDLGIRKGFKVVYGTAELPSRSELERRGERWKPYRTVASWYLWRAAEFEMARAPLNAKRSARQEPSPPASKASVQSLGRARSKPTSLAQPASDSLNRSRTATPSKTRATRSKTQAKRSETQAKRSETQAKRSETQAKRSETQAKRAPTRAEPLPARARPLPTRARPLPKHKKTPRIQRNARSKS